MVNTIRLKIWLAEHVGWIYGRRIIYCVFEYVGWIYGRMDIWIWYTRCVFA